MVVSKKAPGVSRKEILCVLCPRGAAMEAGEIVLKRWPETIDKWTQYFHGADNNAVSSNPIGLPPRSGLRAPYPAFAPQHDFGGGQTIHYRGSSIGGALGSASVVLDVYCIIPTNRLWPVGIEPICIEC